MTLMRFSPILLLAVSCFAWAQENLGDLLDAGAKRLGAAEMQSMLVGANVTGPGMKNTSTDINFLPDGTVKGYIYGGGRGMPITGTYRITDDGKLCVHYEFKAVFPPYDACVNYFSLNSTLYLTYSDTDRNSEIMKRTVKR